MSVATVVDILDVILLLLKKITACYEKWGPYKKQIMHRPLLAIITKLNYRSSTSPQWTILLVILMVLGQGIRYSLSTVSQASQSDNIWVLIS